MNQPKMVELTPELVDALRHTVGINMTSGEDRREKRREARQYIRRWLSQNGVARPQVPK